MPRCFRAEKRRQLLQAQGWLASTWGPSVLLTLRRMMPTRSGIDTICNTWIASYLGPARRNRNYLHRWPEDSCMWTIHDRRSIFSCACTDWSWISWTCLGLLWSEQSWQVCLCWLQSFKFILKLRNPKILKLSKFQSVQIPENLKVLKFQIA